MLVLSSVRGGLKQWEGTPRYSPEKQLEKTEASIWLWWYARHLPMRMMCLRPGMTRWFAVTNGSVAGNKTPFGMAFRSDKFLWQKRLFDSCRCLLAHYDTLWKSLLPTSTMGWDRDISSLVISELLWTSSCIRQFQWLAAMKSISQTAKPPQYHPSMF